MDTLQLQDISSLVEIKHFPTIWLLVLAIALFCFLGWLFLNRLYFKKPAKQLTPFEKAIRGLENLSTENFYHQQKIKEYCLQLSYVIRLYFSESFKIEAVESTTYEFLRKASKLSILSNSQHQELLNFCNTTDKVKFAKGSLSLKQMEALHKWSKDIVFSLQQTLEELALKEQNNNPSSQKSSNHIQAS